MAKIDDEIKVKIHKVMKSTFLEYRPEAYDVAEDFSDKELQEFINTYYHYLTK